jgi:hypothetical protein
MFRRVDLPGRVPGRLLLHSMPGRFEAIESVWHQLRNEAVGAIVCLTEIYEIRLKSSKYAEALEAGTVPCSVLPFEIREGGAPEDRHAFWALANDVANRLQSGESVLIHCAGGVGRTRVPSKRGAGRTFSVTGNAQSGLSAAAATLDTSASARTPITFRMTPPNLFFVQGLPAISNDRMTGPMLSRRIR